MCNDINEQFCFRPWGPGRPKFDNDEHQEGCALMQDFGFGLLNIDQANCELPGKGVMCKKLALKESDCPDGWTGFQEKCYHITGGNWTWGGAKSMCEDLGAIMAAPNTDAEFEYLLSLGASNYFWFGSSDSDNEGTWVNLDGTNYEGPWGPGRPNDLDGSADCMNLLENKNGEMFVNDADCEQSGEGAVCARVMMNHPICAPGWSLYNGVCFNRILGVINYTEAEYLCHSYNSFLASLADIGQMVGTFSYAT